MSSKTVSVLGYNTFSQTTAEALEMSFWSGALVHGMKYVRGRKWHVFASSFMEWEGSNYYVIRMRACPMTGGNPTNDVVDSYQEAMNGYAFLDDWDHLTRTVESWKNSMQGTLWNTPWEFEALDLERLQKEKLLMLEAAQTSSLRGVFQ